MSTLTPPIRWTPEEVERASKRDGKRYELIDGELKEKQVGFESLDAGVPAVWLVNPERRTIRIYRNDGTTKLFRGSAVIENDPLLPGFRLVADEIFPPAAS